MYVRIISERNTDVLTFYNIRFILQYHMVIQLPIVPKNAEGFAKERPLHNYWLFIFHLC